MLYAPYPILIAGNKHSMFLQHKQFTTFLRIVIHLYNTILHILSSLTYYLISDQLFPTNEAFIRHKNYRRLRSTTNIMYQRRKTLQLERTKSATTICLDVHFSLEKCLLKCKARMYSQPTLKLRPMVSEKSAPQDAVETFRIPF